MTSLKAVIRSGQFILGPEVKQLEEAVAHYCKVPHAVGISSGTDALLAALMALEVGPGDIVITSTFSFFATAGVISRLGARPVFVDIAPETFNINSDSLAAAWENLRSEDRARVRAIMPVHLFGQCADMDAVIQFARLRGIAVVEDAAQSLGAEYPWESGDNRKAGTMGTFGCFSFFPSKNLGGGGDGGMIISSDEALAERVRILRVHGAYPKYHHAVIGGNFRLDTLQAAILLVKLPHLDEWHQKRRKSAARYDSLFQEHGLTEFITLPAEVYGGDGVSYAHVYNQYVILTARRDALQGHLSRCGIDTAVYYPLPLHRQPCFSYLGYGERSLPVSEQIAREVLALPIYPGITAAQQEYVVESVQRFYREK